MPWLNLLVYALVFAGFSGFVIAVVNRMHGVRMGYPWLHLSHFAHDAVIVLFIAALVYFTGFTGPRLLLGGALRDLPWTWRGVFAICSLGTLCFAYGAVAHACRRTPPAQVRRGSRVVDVARRLNRSLIGKGPFGYLARLPFNEAFQLDVAERHFQLPRIPAAWEGLRILHLSDWHFIGTVERAYFEEVVKEGAALHPDLIVFTGDLLDGMPFLDWIAPTLGRLRAPLGCWSILGNHDWYLEPAPIRQELERVGWRDVAGRCVTLDVRGLPLALAGDETPWMGEHPDFSVAPPDAFRLLLSHTPDNLPWARRAGVDLMLSGHNHGGQVRLPILGPIYSPSRYGVRYASGVFHEPPTLLHVNRGLSGRHALRWRCRPEISLLVLRSGAETPVPTANARRGRVQAGVP